MHLFVLLMYVCPFSLPDDVHWGKMTIGEKWPHLYPIVIFLHRKWAIREFGIAFGIFLKRTNQNRIEQRHFYELNRIEDGSGLRGRL